MTTNPDYLLERNYHKNQIRKWKLAALLLVFIIIVLLNTNSLWKMHTNSSLPQMSTNDYIASVKIEGVIYSNNQKIIDHLAHVKDNAKAKALLLYIDSPGGTVVGSEKIYKMVRQISKIKPVVILMENVAASGGYMIALGGDYIIAHAGTITGSIGVIRNSVEVTELAKKIGIEFYNFKSGEFKAMPNPTEKLTPEVTTVVMSSINDVYEWFVEMVATRRNIEKNQAFKIADGRIYTGRQALALKLIDAIGDTDDALIWLQQNKDIAPDLKVIEVSRKSKLSLLFDSMQEKMYQSVFNNRMASIMALLQH